MTRQPGLDYELDNTPRWLQDTPRGVGAFCDPFGYESEVRVFGGLRDPRHEQHVWRCQNRADARYRLTCARGHPGQIMLLCERHAWMIRQRMSGMCPACAMPPRAREIEESMNAIMRQMAAADPRRRHQLRLALEDRQREMNELIERGIIRTEGLRLEEVS